MYLCDYVSYCGVLFLPNLKVCVFYGALRTLETEYDLLLTSYGTLRSEKEAISLLHFTIAIFDELQVAKNNHSQIHKALSSLEEPGGGGGPKIRTQPLYNTKPSTPVKEVLFAHLL